MTCANHPDRQPVAFCQNCGKPLCRECTRTVGFAVYCEHCLAAKIAAAEAAEAGLPAEPGPAAYASSTASAGSAQAPASPYAEVPSGGAPRPNPTGPAAGYTGDAPNPLLAGFLGFIPGVGAMYNGQYAKGIVHLIVFAVLTSLADNHGIFGLFVMGWVFYQVFEAFQTAKARRDGLPLPNPFNLNDIGDRFGFGKAWPAAAPAQPGTYAAPEAPIPPAAPLSGSGPVADWTTGYVPPVYTPPAAAYVPPAYVPPVQAAPSQSASSYAAAGTYTPPFTSPYSAAYVPPPMPPMPPIPTRSFPSGAIVLIVLGVLFLLGNTGLFHIMAFRFILPAGLMLLGAWIFYRRLSDPLTAVSAPTQGLRVVRALRGAAFVFIVGLLLLLQSADVVGMSRSWPLFIVLAGVLALAERTLSNQAAQVYVPVSEPVPPPVPAPSVAPEAEAPLHSPDEQPAGTQEGR